MKIVLDTNVVVSATINPKGPPAEIIRAWRSHSFRWVTSLALLDELERTLLSPRIESYSCWSNDEIADFLSTVRQATEISSPNRRIDVITSDPADNRVLEAAGAAAADVIVSGDHHLLALKEWQGIRVLSPADFTEEMGHQ